jgi:hypothetical protein
MAIGPAWREHDVILPSALGAPPEPAWPDVYGLGGFAVLDGAIS